MCNRIAREAVYASLHEDKFRIFSAQEFFHCWPNREKIFVLSARSQRKIELKPSSGTLTSFVGMAGPWIEETTVLVDIGKNYAGIVLEGIVDPVAMMGIDVDIRNS